MKQITLTLATVILCVTFAGCSGGACSHDFSEWMTHEEANCMSQKVQRRNCLLCNRVETRRVGDINSNAHLGLVNAVAPTCQTVGNTGTGTCTRPGCGKTVTGTEIPINPNAHDRTGPWTYDAIAATCTERSKHIRICNYTGCNEVAEEMLGTINPLGHDESGTAATCTTDKICKRDDCGHILTQALGHEFLTTSATCTEDSIPGTCIREGCDEPNSEDVKQALGHAFSTIPATCTTPSIPGTCTREGCNVADPEAVVEALKHDHESSYICKRTDCTHVYTIGDTGPAGGKIFYVAQTGFDLFTGTGTGDAATSVKAHYLEAALADIAGIHAWASSGFTNTGIDGTSPAIGTGRRNTNLILAVDVNAPAALACRNYRAAAPNNAFDDWFLPSTSELQQLRTNISIVGGFATVEYSWYWTSSQVMSYDARRLGFHDDSDPSRGDKPNQILVRPIRAF